MNYSLKSYASLNGGSARDQFSNTLEVATEAALSSAEMAGFAAAFASCLASVMLNTVTINRIVVSTYDQETPEDAINNFRSFAMNVVGGNAPADASTTMYDVNHALVIARNPAMGRAGAILVRGCLTEADVQIGSSGEAMLSPSGRTRFDHVPATFGNGLSLPGFVPSLMRTVKDDVVDGQATLHVSPIVSYGVTGVRLNKRNHRFFNRKKTEGAGT